MTKNYTEEYVKVNGIDHYLLHYPKSNELPVVLFLHGGPGSAESLYAYMLDKSWGNICHQVHWDQRAAGRTLKKNKGAPNPETIEEMVNDLHSIVEYLKQKYHKDKIIILAHSWGTILGSLYALEYPENVLAYIGSGQVVNMMDNERVGFERVMSLAETSNNQKHIKKLESVGIYPPMETDIDTLFKTISKVRKVQDSYEEGSGIFELIKLMMKSPVFKISDLFAMMHVMKHNKALIYKLMTYDLYTYSNQYSVPVHYILGADDLTTPTSLSQIYFDAIEAPIKSMTVISKAGHNPMYERPKDFAEALKKILSRL